MTATAHAAIEIGTRPWQIDAAHTEVEFSVRHLMISNVKGRFGNVTGSLSYDPARPEAIALDVTIPVDTVDTRVAQRDAHLRSADFFDLEKFPLITFKGKHVDGDITGEFTVIGDLTMHGVTREVTLDGTAEGQGGDPWGNERMGFSASTRLDRRQFGLTWNQAIETGGVVVGDQIKITINTELTRPREK